MLKLWLVWMLVLGGALAAGRGEVFAATADDGPVSSRPDEVRRVQIVCANTVLKKKLEKRVQTYLAKKHSTQTLKDFIQTYLHKNNFFFSQVVEKQALASQALAKKGGGTSTATRPGGVIYSILHPYRYRVFIHGMHLLSRNFSGIKLFRLSSSTLQLSDAVREAQQQIYSYYVDNGYPRVQVTYKVQPGSREFERQVRFFVREGSEVKISQLSVYGNISRPASYYEKFIFNQASKKIKNRVFVKKDLNLVYKSLRHHLVHTGYLRAKVQATRVEYVGGTRVKIYIFVNEGPLTLLQNISFQGHHSFSSEELERLVALRPQQPLRIQSIGQSLERIKNFYRQQGFIDVQVEERDLIQYTQQGAAADIQFQITEGPQVRVRDLRIEGLSLTKAFVVRNEIDLKPGDLVSREAINSTTLRLNQLALFSLVDVQVEDSNEAQRDIIIRLQERKPGVFRLGLGVTDKSGYSLRGYVGVLYKNLAGTGRSLSSRITAQQEMSQVKYLEKHVMLSYWEPFFMSPWFKRLRGRLNLTYNEQVSCYEDDLLCPEALVGEKSIAVSSFLEKSLGPHFQLRWKLWSLDWLQYFQRGTKVEALDVQPKKIALVGGGLDVDYTDDILNPRRGTSINLSVDYSSPWVGSSKGVHFVRAEGAVHHHWPLGSIVWAHALRAGYVQNLSPVVGSQVPLKHVFFLGGSQTLRGFSGLGSDRIPSLAQMSRHEQLSVQSSSWYSLLKSELRFPLRGKLSGVLFYDAGGVWIRGYSMSPPVRQGYGLGIRLNTPVGPLSLDYARKVHRLKFANDQLEPAYYVHFSIGTF